MLSYNYTGEAEVYLDVDDRLNIVDVQTNRHVENEIGESYMMERLNRRYQVTISITTIDDV